MGVEAAPRGAGQRARRRSSPRRCGSPPSAPAYLDKTNATTIHAALRLDADVRASTSAVPSARASARCGPRSPATAPMLVVTSDLRTASPASADESQRRRRRGRADRRRRLRRSRDRRVPRRRVAPPRSSSSAGACRVSDASGVWEERFGEIQYAPLVEQAWKRGLEAAERRPRAGRQARRHAACTPARCATSRRASASPKEAMVDDRGATVGNTGAAQAALLLTDALEQAAAGRDHRARVARRRRRRAGLPHHRRDRVVDRRRARSPSRIEWGAPLGYGKLLAWRGTRLASSGPRRPPPGRISAVGDAAAREDWKYAFVGSKDRATGALHLPPARDLA